MEEKQGRPMGIGKLGSSDIIFARKFRFLLEGTTLPCSFVKSVKFDYIERLISFEYLNVSDTADKKNFHALKWAFSDLKNETFTFKTLDGCGYLINEVKFKGIEVIEHTSDYDYASSDVASQKILVRYNDIFFEETNKVMQYPTMHADVEIDEVEVNYLNEKTWLPGKIKIQKTSKVCPSV
jgi:hypothetical protein